MRHPRGTVVRRRGCGGDSFILEEDEQDGLIELRPMFLRANGVLMCHVKE